MWERISMFLSFTKSQWDWFSTEENTNEALYFIIPNTGSFYQEKHLKLCSSFHNWHITEIINRLRSLTFHDTPGVKTTSDPLTSGLHYCITANDSKWSTLLQHTQTQQQSFLLHLSALNHKSSGSRQEWYVCLTFSSLSICLNSSSSSESHSGNW